MLQRYKSTGAYAIRCSTYERTSEGITAVGSNTSSRMSEDSSSDVQKGCSTSLSDLLHGGHKLGSEGQAAGQQAMLHFCVHLQLLVHSLGKQQAHHKDHLRSSLSRHVIFWETFLDLCMSCLCEAHANLLCIAPVSTDVIKVAMGLLSCELVKVMLTPG